MRTWITIKGKEHQVDTEVAELFESLAVETHESAKSNAILTKKVETLRGALAVNKEQVKKEFLSFETAVLLNQQLKTLESLKELAEVGLTAMTNVAASLIKLEEATK